MAGDLTASLVLKLQDELSGGLRKLTEQLEQLRGISETIQMKGLTDAADQAKQLNGQLGKTEGLLSRIGRGFTAMGNMARETFGGLREGVAGLGHSITRFQEASSNLVNRGFGAAAEGFAVYEPMKKYADYENIVRHIGITEGLAGAQLDARIAKLQEFFREDALRTGQSSESVAQAYQDLTQMGIHENLDTIIQAHSRAATAYNTTAEALGPAVGALIQTLKVPADQLAATLSGMAQASKEGRFKIEDFSRELPGVAAQMALLGMTGRKAADTTFAALETVMRGASNPGQAAVNLTDLLQYIRSPFAARHFAKQGIDIHTVLEHGLKSGDIIGAVLDAVQKKVKGADQVKFAEELGKLFHNQQAGSALISLIQQRKDFEALRAKLQKLDSGVVERDFISGFDAPVVQMRIMSEEIEQLTERFGQGFLPVLKTVNMTFWYLNAGLKWATEHYPKLTGNVLSGMAALIGLGAALGLIGAIFPLISTGFGIMASGFALLASPILVVLTLLGSFAGAAYDIYAHWDRFRGYFEDMWAGVKQIFWGFISFVADSFMVGLGHALNGDGASQMAAGIVRAFAAMWDAVKQVFTDFVGWVDAWSQGLGTRIVKGIAAGFAAVPAGLEDALLSAIAPALSGLPIGDLVHLLHQKTAAPANDNGNAAASVNPASLAPVNGRVDVHVHADPGTAVTGTQSSGAVNVQTPVTAPQRGATVGRP